MNKDAHTISELYIIGIKEGRQLIKQEGYENIKLHIENIKNTKRMFHSKSPVGPLLQGELDFLKNNLEKKLHIKLGD